MSLCGGRRAGAEPQRRAAPDRRPMDRSRNRTRCCYRAGVSPLGFRGRGT
jgi:hypothetical protein